jgi:hypothetical protein
MNKIHGAPDLVATFERLARDQGMAAISIADRIIIDGASLEDVAAEICMELKEVELLVFALGFTLTAMARYRVAEHAQAALLTHLRPDQDLSPFML